LKLKPIDIAKRLNISTSALRNYEARQIVPYVERSSNGYRVYTEAHLAYFECIHAMVPGFGMEATAEVMQHVQAGDAQAALWIAKKKEASLYNDKATAENTIQALRKQHDDCSAPDSWMTIREVAEHTITPKSTIRHWEKLGLITSARNPHNGYRLFNQAQVRKMMLVRALRESVYSLDVVRLKQAIGALDAGNIEGAIQIAQDSLEYFNKINKAQLRGLHYLYCLCKRLDLLE
jgi:DNA-binding transcriptional MerR regulator